MPSRYLTPEGHLCEFTVIDKPTPMGRKRVFTDKAGNKHFAPESKDVRSLYMIRACFVERYPEWTPIKNSVKLSVRYWHKIPAATSRKKRKEAWMNPKAVKTKPDIPNLLAQVADALTGYAYVDDSLISWSECWKFYAVDREGNDTPPRFSIKVEEL